ncbi:MAG: type II toxin-antitoxin system VapC family toxin [Candidatus Bathyarchaeia archaeon]
MILIDSYGWLEYFLDGPLSEKYAKAVEQVNDKDYVTPTIVVYEVYKRVRSIQGEKSALEAYAQIARTKIVELTAQTALEAAEISLSKNLGMADALILATARAFNAEILTSDKHLKDFEETRFIGNTE